MKINVALEPDQWPAVLYALQELAETKTKEHRTLAAARANDVRGLILDQLIKGIEA